MCIFRLLDPELEQAIYRDVFGVDRHDGDPGRDLDAIFIQSTEKALPPDDQPRPELVSAR